MTTPRVAAIVLNFNGKDITLGAIRSVLAMTYANAQVVHVDNGSSDGSYDAVAATFPAVIQVRTETNLGVSGGYNLGMSWALERGYDYILMLNNDIEVEPAFLTELVAVAERDPTVGCVGPKVYYFWDRGRIWSAGGVISFRESVTRERGLGELDRGQFDQDVELNYVNGCGMLMRARAVAEAGLWDPAYHMCAEDADWCMRIRARGFRVWYAHKAVLYHMVSQATGVYTPKRTYQSGRSTAIFVRRHANPLQWAAFLACIGAALPVAYLREWRRGNQEAVRAKLRGLIDGMRVALPAPPKAG